MKKLLSVLLLLLFVQQANAIEFFNGSFDAALATAQKSNKQLLVVFSAKWCHPCMQMKKEVFAADAIAEVANKRYVALSVDTDTKEGKQLYARFYDEAGISIPAFVICNERGQMLKEYTGAMRVKEFAQFLKQESQVVENVNMKQLQGQSGSLQSNEPTKVNRALNAAYKSQWKPGIRVGVHQSSFATNKMLDAYPEAILGWDLGVFVDYTKEGFVFQPGLMYSSKGAMAESSNSEIRLSYIEFPLQVSLKILDHRLLGCPQDVRVNIAPYAGWAIGGNESIDGEETNVSFGKDAGEFNPLDYGLKLGVSMALGSFEPYVGYRLGLQNISNDAGTEINNRGLYLNFALIFGK